MIKCVFKADEFTHQRLVRTEGTMALRFGNQLVEFDFGGDIPRRRGIHETRADESGPRHAHQTSRDGDAAMAVVHQALPHPVRTRQTFQ